VFFDLSCIAKAGCLVDRLVQLALEASLSKWEVVVAASSGAGWTTGSQNLTEQKIGDFLSGVGSSFQLIVSQNFTRNEADVFIGEYMIDSKKLDEACIEANNNPRILRTFAHTCPVSALRNPTAKYLQCLRTYRRNMRNLVADLILVMKRKEFDRNLRESVMWLENARHGVSVPMDQFQQYQESYLACENLTYACTSEDTFEIKLHIPDVYDCVVDELRDKYKKRDTEVYSIPLVRGYIFENEFLSSKKLHETPLTVLAVNVDTSVPFEFNFPSLIPSNSQLSGPLKTKLEERRVYYLRKRHPAIDAVVCIETTDEDTRKCLLLLQVSISPYKEYTSKGKDIRKTIPTMEKGEGSIAEYYQKLCGDIADDRVIYVYVSPKETSPPSHEIFNEELSVRYTKSGRSVPRKFWYGFLKSNSPGAKLMERIEESI
jgi:hypothetical protein